MAKDEDVLTEAKRLVDRGHFHDAVSILMPWVEQNPLSAGGWSALGAAHFEMGDLQSALSAARNAVEIEPGNVRSWCNYGIVLRKLGRVEEARQAQEKAIALEPDYRRAHKELGKLPDDSLPIQNPSSSKSDDRSARDDRVANGRAERRWLLGKCAIGLVVVVALAVALTVILYNREDRLTGARLATEPAEQTERVDVLPDASLEDEGAILLSGDGGAAAGDRSASPDGAVSVANDAKVRRQTARAWLSYGKHLYAEQKYSEAIDAFDKAESMGSNASTWLDACHRRIDIAEGRLVESDPGASVSTPPPSVSYVHTYEQLTDDDLEALLAARRVIREHAWNPSSVKFGWGFLGLEGPDSTRVARSGDVCVVGGRFRGQNAFGATIESPFAVTLIRVDGRWVTFAYAID